MAAPQRAAMTAQSAPKAAAGVSTITWSNLVASSRMSRPNAGRSTSSSGLGGVVPTGSTNRLGTPLTCWITWLSARPLRMPDRPERFSSLNTSCRRGLRMSASTSSVRPPSCASEAARLAAQ